MLGPCYPIAKAAVAVVARPVRHAVHHVVRRAAYHAPPRPAAVPRPQPAVDCVRQPGALPAGSGATPVLAVPALAAASPGAGSAARIGAASAGAGLSGGAGAMAAIAAAAGLALGGATIASTMPFLFAADAVPLPSPAGMTDTLRVVRLAGELPSFMTGAPDLVGPNQFLLPPGSAMPDMPPGAPSGSNSPEVPDAVAVPEPTSLALLGLGSLGTILARRRFRRAGLRQP